MEKTTDPINALELLGVYTVDARSRHEKYTKRVDDGRRGLANRLRHAIQEITNRGQYMIRITNPAILPYTITFQERLFHVMIVDKGNNNRHLDNMEYGELIKLADSLTKSKYVLLTPEQDEFYANYLKNSFSVDDEALRIAERDVEKHRKTFDDNLNKLLQDLKKVGLCLKFNPIWSNGGSNFIVASTSIHNTTTNFFTEQRNSGNPTAGHISELRKLMRANEVKVVPFDQAFNK